MNACRRHLVAFLGCISIMWTELRHSGIFDDVAQWHSLATFLNSLTVFSTCWQYCFPGLPPPSIPMGEYESIQQLPQLDLIIEVLMVVRIALQIPTHSMARSSHTVANRYELHRCRNTAYLLICFLRRLISQNHGYIPPFFEVLHFTRRHCCVTSCTLLLRICDTFDHCGHASRTSLTSFRIQVTISNHASTSDSHHGIVPTMLE